VTAVVVVVVVVVVGVVVVVVAVVVIILSSYVVTQGVKCCDYLGINQRIKTILMTQHKCYQQN